MNPIQGLYSLRLGVALSPADGPLGRIWANEALPNLFGDFKGCEARC